MGTRIRSALFRKHRWFLLLLFLAVLSGAVTVLQTDLHLPPSWVTAVLAQQGLGNGESPLSVEVARASWRGFNRLVLHDAVVGEGVSGYGIAARRAEIRLGIADLMPWLSPPAGRRVVLHDGRLVPKGNSLLASMAYGGTIREAELEWGEDQLTVERAVIATPWGDLRLEGRMGETYLDVRLYGVVQDAAELARRLGFPSYAGTIHGPAEVIVAVEGSPETPQLHWRLEAEDLTWTDNPWLGKDYRIRGVAARGSWGGDPDEPVLVERLVARVADFPSENASAGNSVSGPDENTANGSGGDRSEESLRTVELAGSFLPGGPWALQVQADGLQLPGDVPVVREWGIAGKGSFVGRIDGRWPRLRLSGTVEMGPGRLWDQPVDRARATIAWDGRRLEISASRIDRGVSVYRLAGSVGLEDKDLDLLLETEQGRAETLLQVLGWGHIPLTGEVQGTLRFRGPFGSLESEGSLQLKDGSGWAQRFDEVAAVYRWDRTDLHLEDGTFRLGGGVGEFAGRVGMAGGMDLQVNAAGLPLEQLEAVRRAGHDLLAGRIDFNGRVRGSLDDPEWEGRVSGRRLRIGRLDFGRGGGELALSRGAWEVRDLVLERESGARYTASGWVDATPSLPTLVHLVVGVEGETLEDALSMMGVGLAYPLASGRVVGRGLLVGELARPDGEVILHVQDGQLAGRPAALNVELDVAGGLVRVRQLNLGTPQAGESRRT